MSELRKTGGMGQDEVSCVQGKADSMVLRCPYYRAYRLLRRLSVVGKSGINQMLASAELLAELPRADADQQNGKAEQSEDVWIKNSQTRAFEHNAPRDYREVTHGIDIS